MQIKESFNYHSTNAFLYRKLERELLSGLFIFKFLNIIILKASVIKSVRNPVSLTNEVDIAVRNRLNYTVNKVK